MSKNVIPEWIQKILKGMENPTLEQLERPLVTPQKERAFQGNEQEREDILRMRKEHWTRLSKSPEGTIYVTPSGKYLLKEAEDGTMERLTRIDKERE